MRGGPGVAAADQSGPDRDVRRPVHRSRRRPGGAGGRGKGAFHGRRRAGRRSPGRIPVGSGGRSHADEARDRHERDPQRRRDGHPPRRRGARGDPHHDVTHDARAQAPEGKLPRLRDGEASPERAEALVPRQIGRAGGAHAAMPVEGLDVSRTQSTFAAGVRLPAPTATSRRHGSPPPAGSVRMANEAAPAKTNPTKRRHPYEGDTSLVVSSSPDDLPAFTPRLQTTLRGGRARWPSKTCRETRRKTSVAEEDAPRLPSW